MAVYVLLVAALVLLAGGSCVLMAGRLGWLRRHRRLPAASPSGAATRVSRVPFVGRGGHVEAVLTSRLFAGKLGSADYRRAMAELAADDSVRHPMVVPRDRGNLVFARVGGVAHPRNPTVRALLSVPSSPDTIGARARPPATSVKRTLPCCCAGPVEYHTDTDVLSAACRSLSRLATSSRTSGMTYRPKSMVSPSMS